MKSSHDLLTIFSTKATTFGLLHGICELTSVCLLRSSSLLISLFPKYVLLVHICLDSSFSTTPHRQPPKVMLMTDHEKL
jgi:hypothetical protein